jgi:YD repeat-containing protein
VLSEGGHLFKYDKYGKLITISGYGHGNLPGDYPLVFQYDDKGRVVGSSYATGKTAQVRSVDYDALGRPAVTVSRDSWPTSLVTRDEYSYEIKGADSLIYITSTALYVHYEQPQVLHEYYYLIAYRNGNMIRFEKLPSGKEREVTQVFVNIYEYSDKPNKLQSLYKKIGPALNYMGPMSSKMLPTKVIANGITTNYNFILNEHGYPLNNGITTDAYYSYECK